MASASECEAMAVRFEDAAAAMRLSAAPNLAMEDKLHLYAFYKQVRVH